MTRHSLALSLPPALATRLAGLRHAFEAGHGRLNGVVWRNPNTLHITLCPIGSTSRATRDKILELVKHSPPPASALRFAYFRVTGARTHSRLAGRLKLYLRQAGPLYDYQRHLCAWLQPYGIHTGKYRFSPHITLALLSQPVDLTDFIHQACGNSIMQEPLQPQAPVMIRHYPHA